MRVALVLLPLVLAACGTCGPPPPRPPYPQPGELNPYVLEVIATYPTDGTHGYHWPKTGSWAGNARTIRYGDEVLYEGDAEGRCHCSGLTFEVFMQAMEAWCKAQGVPYRIKKYGPDAVRSLQRAWFGTDGDRSTIWGAVLDRNLGIRMTNWEEAQDGDFIQLWRHSGSGHSAVFRRWEREEGAIVGLTYWSTQGSTHGIGENTEFFGDDGSSVKRDELYIVRIGEER